MKKTVQSLYDSDYYEWTRQTAELLRAGKMNDVDVEHLAEEIEDMGNRDRREVHNRLRVLLTNLLRWMVQPGYRGASWRATISEQRDQLELVLQDSPSLRRYVGEQLGKIYQKASAKARAETDAEDNLFYRSGLELQLPESCPFSLDQTLDPAFWPTAR